MLTRGTIVVIAITMMCLTASLPAAVAHRDATNESRSFVADDRDPRAGAVPPFVYIGPRAENGDGPSLATAARMRDFDYRTTAPSFTVGARNRTLAEYRHARLQAIGHNRSTSRWPAHAPEPRDGVFVDDAYVAFMGASGARLTTGANDTTQPYLLPRNGQVYSLLDYRTDLPARTCDRQDGNYTCISYRLVNQTVVRRLSIGNQSWPARGRTHRVIDYSDVQARDETTLRLSATVTVTAERITRVFANRSVTTPLRTNRTEVTDTLTVSDSRPVVITTNQPLAVTQRIITTTDGGRTVVLTFDGPVDPTSRRLWSVAHLRNATIRNVWAVYSQRRSQTGWIATDEEAREYDLPHVLGVRVTARTERPTLQRHGDRPVDGVYPELVTTASTVRSPPAQLRPTVNLSTAPTRIPRQLVITDAPSPVTGIVDVHGDRIPLATTEYDQRAAALSLTRLNDTHARLQLTDARTGNPLQGRTVLLQHARVQTVTTNEDGTAIVKRAGIRVRATFPGTDVTTDRSRYYAAAQAAVTFPTSFSIYDAIVSLSGAAVSVVGLVILVYPLRTVLRTTTSRP